MRGPALALSSQPDRLRHPFEFPYGGRMVAPSPTINLGLTAGARQTVYLAAPGTSGIVRNLAWIASAANAVSTAVQSRLTLEIFYDGNVVADVSIPLWALAGVEHPRSVFKDLRFSTYAFEVTEGPSTTLFPGVITGASGNFRLPIPYTNGIKIDLVAPAGTDVSAVFCNVLVQTPLPSSWNNGLRLFAARSNETVPTASVMPNNYKLTDATHMLSTAGSFPANIAGRVIIDGTISTHDMLCISRTDNTHIVVSSIDTQGAVINVVTGGGGFHAALHTFLSRPAGKSGYVALIVGGQSNPSGDIDVLFEANPRFWLDQNAGEPDLEWTSIEDFANGSFYFEQPNQSDEGGCTEHDPTTNYESCIYKAFHRHPIAYTNGIRGAVPQYSGIGASTYNWTTFYYEQQ